MNENAINRFSARLVNIADRARKIVTWPIPDPDAMVFITRREADFGFDAATNEEFESVLIELLKNHQWSEKFSEEFLREKLLDVVSSLIKADLKGDVGSAFRSLVAAYEAFALENVVLLPIGGIDLQVSEMKIGKITLRKLKRDDQQGPLSKLDALSAGRGWAKQYGDVKKRFFGGGELPEVVCAEYRAIAEPRRAEERAVEECNRVLELLRFAAPTLYDDHLSVEIGYLWEVVETRGAVITVQAEKPAFHSSSRKTGPASAFELNEGNLQTLESIGALRVGRILEKPYNETTEFERTILRAIHWFGTSVRQPDIENKFLNLLICIESLLSPKEREPISNAISEGVAFVLGDGLQGRISLKKRMKELYGIRSGLSHGGKKDILEIDLIHLREIAGGLLVWAIKRADEFKSHQALFDWIEMQKLT